MPKIEHRLANRTVICVWHDLKFIKHINVQQLEKTQKMRLTINYYMAAIHTLKMANFVKTKC